MSGFALAIGVALLLGLRHATDPDHLTAVSTLVMSEERSGHRRAGVLGLSWGLGHAITLFALGLPVVLLGARLPDGLGRGAEIAIGIVIVALAVRMLVRWRRGYMHAHVHSHGSIRHWHPHLHEHAGEHVHVPHEHLHASALGRRPLAAFGIGLLHGVGGSAGVGILVVAAASQGVAAAVALLVFALGTALSMAACSAAFGLILTSRRVGRSVAALAPAAGMVALAFGAWYALAAVQIAPALI
jgi:cytochrome c biogenesis protein CcdA